MKDQLTSQNDFEDHVRAEAEAERMAKPTNDDPTGIRRKLAQRDRQYDDPADLDETTINKYPRRGDQWKIDVDNFRRGYLIISYHQSGDFDLLFDPEDGADSDMQNYEALLLAEAEELAAYAMSDDLPKAVGKAFTERKGSNGFPPPSKALFQSWADTLMLDEDTLEWLIDRADLND